MKNESAQGAETLRAGRTGGQVTCSINENANSRLSIACKEGDMATNIDSALFREFISSINLGNPTQFDNLTVFPLFSDRSRDDGYALLDEAISTDKFTVAEVSEGGHVPELSVTNLLDRDVLIVDGEELVGAKQNRIVNTTIIIGRLQKLVIPVSCVEQGRWRYRTQKFSSSKSNLYADLRKRKSKAVHRSLKAAASFSSDQSDIWRDISEKSSRFAVHSETSSMEDIFVSYEEQIERYEKQFIVAEGQVGFIAVIGNKIAGMDIFGSRSVMPKIFRKLLRGYILDALDQKVTEARRTQKEQEAGQVDGDGLASEAAEFLRRVTSARKETFKSVGSGDELRFSSRFTNGFALVNGAEVVHVAAFAE